MNPQLEELACLYVLDRLEPGERAGFEAQLARDPALAALVHELETALERRIRELPPHEPPAGLLDRIEARLDAAAPATPPAAPATARFPVPSWAAIARWGVAAAVVLGAGALAFRYALDRPAAAARPVIVIVGLDADRSTLAELPLPERERDADARFFRLASLAEQFWEQPEVLSARLGPGGKGCRSYALYDPGSSQGFIAIRQLPSVDPGKRYHLWILDTATGRAREAGILPLTGSDRGLYFFSVEESSAPAPERLDFCITAEDPAAPKATRPRGRVVLGETRI